ncbi:MAG: 4Fe-4S binding protein [Phycisphaera sp.]|nr:4Fe-4S binding protein [Phycisphaera sp.]
MSQHPSAGILESPDRVLSTLNADGSRRWIQPRPSHGRFRSWRRIVALGLVLVFTILPWIRIHERPAILLDVVRREFTVFGTTFRPTDTIVLALSILTFFMTVFLATAVLGRVWCGWACPQTVYMEFIFRPIEQLVLGKPGSRRRARPPAWRRLLCWGLFLLVAAHLANTFLAYFVGTDELVEWTRHSPLEHPTPFLVFASVAVLMMFDFTYFREQMCTLACPYGRMQSALLDRNSLVVGYDVLRGEPRGAMKRKSSKTGAGGSGCGGNCGNCRKKTEFVPLGILGGVAEGEGPDGGDGARSHDVGSHDSGSCGSGSTGPEPVAKGDCIDCRACVNTCPTGIDIRDGLQLECIQCAQCIDACDAVMDKIGRPRGLVRYSTQDVLEQSVRRRLRWRLLIYPLLLGISGASLFLVLFNREVADVVPLRSQVAPFRILDDGRIENLIRLRIDNRGRDARSFSLVAQDGDDLRFDLNPVPIEAGSSGVVVVRARSGNLEFERGRRTVRIRVEDGGEFDRICDFDLLGPLGPLTRGGTR